MIPAFASADFARAIQNLLPSGWIWPRDSDAVQSQVAAVLAGPPYRNYLRSLDVLREVLPPSTVELLPEWEASLGLPDPCAGQLPSFEQRRAQVVARFANQGGQTIGLLTAFAAALGFAVTVTEFSPAVAGGLRAGQPLNGAPWAFALQIHSPAQELIYARAGALVAGDPLVSWGNAVLECEFGRIVPAHAVLIFTYG